MALPTFLGITPNYAQDSAQGLLLAVFKGPYVVPGIECGLAARKASVLLPLHCIQPRTRLLGFVFGSHLEVPRMEPGSVTCASSA